MRAEINYRPEIDGLRAVAVIAVMLFHIDGELLPGGFLGVDVFFVISGYLITSIISRQLDDGRFSLIGFWKRRFRRLYPALAAMVVGTLVLGTLILPQPERGDLIKQAAASLASLSNILLWWSTGGYWSVASENIALLHTWSLSLEEQFYLVLPIFLVAVHRAAGGRIQSSIAVIATASVAGCIWVTLRNPNAAFYLLPTRMWELLIGGVLALNQHRLPGLITRWKVTVAHTAGIALVVSSFFLVSNNGGFPGLYPLWPCLGTAIIIAFGKRRSAITSTLSAPPVVYVGKVSYSLYLWHWPVIVFWHFADPNPNLPLLGLAIAAVTVASYHCIEAPFRNLQRNEFRWIAAGAGTVAAAFTLFLYVPRSPFLASLGNFDDPVSLTRGWQYEATNDIRNREKRLYTPDGRRTIVVAGSSHARVLCKPIETYAKEHGFRFVSMTTSGIGATTDAPVGIYDDAKTVNDQRWGMIEELKPSVLVLAGMWIVESLQPGFDQRLTDRLVRASSRAERVIVVGQVPLIELPKHYERSLRKYVVAVTLSGEPLQLTPAPRVAQVNATVAEIVRRVGTCNILFVDPTALFTSADGNVRAVLHDRWMYSDQHHLNDSGASILFENLIVGHLN